MSNMNVLYIQYMQFTCGSLLVTQCISLGLYRPLLVADIRNTDHAPSTKMEFVQLFCEGEVLASSRQCLWLDLCGLDVPRLDQIA